MICNIMFYSFDEALFLRLNQWHHPFMDMFFILVTDTFFWIPLYVALTFFVQKQLGWRGIALFILTIAIADQSSAAWLKPFCMRYRPCHAIASRAIHLVGNYQGLYGFPSTHATNTFAFATLFWVAFKDRYPFSYLFFIWATIVSYGRIYGGVHYPLDVLCGAIFGFCIGLLMAKINQKVRGL